MIHFGDVPAGSTLYIPFASYNSTGASVTLTGLATTDIEIYKNGSITQRASDNGYALLDTDGIDFDGVTGLHGFSVDLSDNSDSGFFSVGGQYWIVVSAVTIDSQTVNFIAGTFRIVAAESISGTPKVDVSTWTGTAVASPDTAGYPKVTIKSGTGTGEVSLSSGAVSANVTAISGDSAAADNLEAATDGNGYNIGGGQVVAASVTAGVTLGADAVSAAALAASAIAEIKTAVEETLSTSTRAELASVPAASATLVDKVTWMYMLLRNRRTQSNTTETVYADDGSTSVATSTKSDDGTTYTRGEYL